MGEFLAGGDSIIRDTQRRICDGCADSLVTCLSGAVVVGVVHHLGKLVGSAGKEAEVMVHVSISDVGN